MITRSTSYLLIVLSVFFSEKLIAQKIDVNKAIVDETEWNEGTITLNDGSTLSGLLKLNTKTGVLGYEKGATSKSFTARTVVTFNYFDAAENKKRYFLSISYDNLTLEKHASKKNRAKPYAESGVPQFFEVLVECKTMALISTIGRMNIRQWGQNPYETGGVGYVGTSSVYSRNETLLVLTEDGTAEIVLDVTNEERDNIFIDDNITYGDFNKSVLKKYTEPHFEELEAYAKERKLKFKKRDDLIQIFEYYKSLSAE